MDISPDKQNIDRVFSKTAYYIDFYQRDYRWTDEPVRCHERMRGEDGRGQWLFA